MFPDTINVTRIGLENPFYIWNIKANCPTISFLWEDRHPEKRKYQVTVSGPHCGLDLFSSCSPELSSVCDLITRQNPDGCGFTVFINKLDRASRHNPMSETPNIPRLHHWLCVWVAPYGVIYTAKKTKYTRSFEMFVFAYFNVLWEVKLIFHQFLHNFKLKWN